MYVMFFLLYSKTWWNIKIWQKEIYFIHKNIYIYLKKTIYTIKNQNFIYRNPGPESGMWNFDF